MQILPEAIEILDKRGLDIEVAMRLGCETCTDYGGKRLRGIWVRWPYWSLDGKRINSKYQRLDEKSFMMEKGKKLGVFNAPILLDETLWGGPLVITEGENDACVAVQNGFLAAISVPNGAPSEDNDDPEAERARYRFLDDYLPLIGKFDPIILATDNDGPGELLRRDLAVRIGRAKSHYLVYPFNPKSDPGDPERCKDLRDVQVHLGPEAVRATVIAAKPIEVDGLFRMSELPILPYAKPHVIPGMGLDAHARLRLGDFAVLTGIPGYGKTTFVNDICCRMTGLPPDHHRFDLALDHAEAEALRGYGWPIAWASFENEPTRDHRRDLRTWFAYVRTPQGVPDAATIRAADRWIDDRFVFMVPKDAEEVGLPWLVDKVEIAAARYGCRMAVVDPWNEMDHLRPNGMSLTEYTGYAIKELRRLARRLSIFLLVVTHPAKQKALPPSKKLPLETRFAVPSLYDISDSAHWANKPDLGMIVHRFAPHKMICKVAKSRYWDEIGKVGTVAYQFHPHLRRFSPMELEDIPADALVDAEAIPA